MFQRFQLYKDSQWLCICFGKWEEYQLASQRVHTRASLRRLGELGLELFTGCCLAKIVNSKSESEFIPCGWHVVICRHVVTCFSRDRFVWINIIVTLLRFFPQVGKHPKTVLLNCPTPEGIKIANWIQQKLWNNMWANQKMYLRIVDIFPYLMQQKETSSGASSPRCFAKSCAKEVVGRVSCAWPSEPRTVRAIYKIVCTCVINEGVDTLYRCVVVVFI